MAFQGELPMDLAGQNYRISDPEIEFLGLTGRSQGVLPELRTTDGQWRSLAPAELWRVPFLIHMAFKEDIASGKGDDIGMVIVPRIGGLTLCHIGLIKPQNLMREQIIEGDSYVGIANVQIADHLMPPGRQTLEVRMSSELDDGNVVTAYPDGTPL